MEEINVVETMEMVEEVVAPTVAKGNFGKGVATGGAIVLGVYGLYKGGKWAIGKIKDAKAKKAAECESDVVLDEEE